MQLHHIAIQGEENRVHILITDDIADVKDKLEAFSNKQVDIEVYTHRIVEIQVDKLGIYRDANTKFSLLFNRAGKLVGFYQSDYYMEEDIVTLNFIDDLGNAIEMDLCDNIAFDIATESIALKTNALDDNDVEDCVLHRGTVESPVGEWKVAYLEMCEPFIPIMFVHKSWLRVIPYKFEELNLFTEEAIDNVIEYSSSL